ncbi:GspH/FimT family pseudopilin [Alkanindiges sp. WGS2144]|uniref:GspH/FimT family pseudopilin n=1 Tax=Alkanindiges sp. WGS2144 TaxID=3366808 RepID=UPI003750F6E6
MKFSKFFTGFTLFELVTVMAVISITVLISIPFFTSLLRKQEANQLYSVFKPVLSQARARASTLHQPIALCGSSNRLTCDHNWNAGILTFIDQNKNRSLDAAEQILEHHPTRLKYGSMQWRGAGLSRANVLLFEPERGRLNMSNGSFWYCAEQAQWHRLIILSTMGHVRPSKDSNGDGIHETASGRNIRC